MEDYNYQQPKKNNNGLIIGLSIVAGLLLLALVGVLAYNFGKDKGDTNEPAPAENVQQTTTATAPATAPAAAPAKKGDESAEEAKGAEEAQQIVSKVRGKEGTVLKVTHEEKKEIAPQLYDLTSLQRDANRSLYLTEYNTSNGVESGYLEGRLSNEGGLSGSFINSRGNTYRVSLKVK